MSARRQVWSGKFAEHCFLIKKGRLTEKLIVKIRYVKLIFECSPILKETKNLVKWPKMIILRRENVIFERVCPLSKFHFPACSTLHIIWILYFLTNILHRKAYWLFLIRKKCINQPINASCAHLDTTLIKSTIKNLVIVRWFPQI